MARVSATQRLLVAVFTAPRVRVVPHDNRISIVLSDDRVDCKGTVVGESVGVKTGSNFNNAGTAIQAHARSA
jgi:hypothetical protein